jgi:hypothetical protein
MRIVECGIWKPKTTIKVFGDGDSFLNLSARASRSLEGGREGENGPNWELPFQVLPGWFYLLS